MRKHLLFLITTLLLTPTAFAQDPPPCLDSGFYRVFGDMSNHTNASASTLSDDTCLTGITFAMGDALVVCAKGTVELNNINTVRPQGGIVAGGGFRLPGSTEGALLGVIGGTTFSIGRCFNGPAPAGGELELVVNDEFYDDNTGSFKVLLRNDTTGVGSAIGVSTWTVMGTSTGAAWSYGLGRALPNDVAPGAIAITPNPVAMGAGPAGFPDAFVASINPTFIDAFDPECYCASCGAPGAGIAAIGTAFGCPAPAAAFTVHSNGGAVGIYTTAGGIGIPTAAGFCAGPVLAPGGTCSFNPMLVAPGTSGFGSSQAVPVLSTWLLAFFALLLLFTAWRFFRSRSPA